MAGALSSIGIGSEGALSYDIIDQLKDADKDAIINPIQKRIDTAKLKQTTLSTIKSMVLDINKTIGDVVNKDSFSNIKNEISGDSVSVIEAKGLKEQNINLDVEQLAQKSIFESDNFSATSSSFSANDETLTFTLGIDPNTTKIIQRMLIRVSVLLTLFVCLNLIITFHGLSEVRRVNEAVHRLIVYHVRRST